MTPRAPAPPPAGYARERLGSTELVARADLLPQVAAAVRETSLYRYAASRPGVRVLEGRGPVYVAPLPEGGPTVVVRHTRHGGLLAPITRDRFAGATRAPRELAMSLRLHAMGIATPTLVAYVLYPAGPGLRSSDIATLLIDHSADLAAILGGTAPAVERDAAITAASLLLVAMARGGVRHADLNLKNILIANAGASMPRAYLLDIDRVHVDSARAKVAVANAARLVRSAIKWRTRRGAPITDAEIRRLEAAALGAAT